MWRKGKGRERRWMGACGWGRDTISEQRSVWGVRQSKCESRSKSVSKRNREWENRKDKVKKERGRGREGNGKRDKGRKIWLLEYILTFMKKILIFFHFSVYNTSTNETLKLTESFSAERHFETTLFSVAIRPLWSECVK